MYQFLISTKFLINVLYQIFYNIFIIGILKIKHIQPILSVITTRITLIITLQTLAFFPTSLSAQQELIDIRTELQNKKDTDSKTKSLELLNVSYDPTREFYESYNELFTNWWREHTGQKVTVIQSHGGSGTQARAVISGLEADVVTLALGLDIDAIQSFTKVIGNNWQQRLPNNSSPYYSTIVFLVRKGNPKKIYDWDDLIKSGVSVITPNPKTSGSARWGYLAAWNWAMEKFNKDEEKTKKFMRLLYQNTPFLDTGARGSTTTFVQRKLGDVLITWENEAYLTKEKLGWDNYEIIYPSISIKAEPPVTWVDEYINENNTQDVAKFYLKFLYSLSAQKLIAAYHFRPYDSEVLENFKDKYPPIKMTTIENFGGWSIAQNMHFRDEGTFDDIYLGGVGGIGK